jgi:hypothetical protein
VTGVDPVGGEGSSLSWCCFDQRWSDLKGSNASFRSIAAVDLVVAVEAGHELLEAARILEPDLLFMKPT